MEQKFKKLRAATSLALCLCMLVSIIPTAFAAEKSETASQTSMEDELSISGNDSFGDLIAQSLDEVTQEQEENLGYNVFSVEVSGNTAAVEYEALSDSSLVVAIYDEDCNKMIASGVTEVTKDEKTAEVTIDTDEMPQYFYVKAYLVDTDYLRPLCTAYESPMYTQEMQELLAMSANDFDEERVLNLDDDVDNNFAVYEDTTKVITPADGVNNLVSADDQNQIYVFENVDENITSLQPGEIFSYVQADGNTLIVKIAEITVDGTTATIKGQQTDLEEVFEYVKIDGASGIDENTEVDPSTCDPDVIYEGMVQEEDQEEESYDGPIASGLKVDINKTKSAALEYTFSEAGPDALKISGGLELKVAASVDVYISKSKKYVEAALEYSADISAKLSSDLKKSFDLTKVIMTIAKVVNFEFTPSIIFECETELSIGAKLEGSIGLSATKNGIKNISETPSLDTRLEMQGKLSVSLSLKPQISIVSKHLAEVELEGIVGVEATAKPTGMEECDSDECIHSCKNCLTGELRAKMSLNLSASLVHSFKLKFVLTEVSIKISDFYYSFTHRNGGWSTCPYWQYKVTATVVDEQSKPVSGVTLNNKYTTDENGRASFFLNNGKNTVKLRKEDGASLKEVVEVKGEPTSFKFVLGNAFVHSGGTGNSGGGGGTSIGGSSGVVEYAKVREVSLGAYHSSAITENGDLYMWGDDMGADLFGEYYVPGGYLCNPAKYISNIKTANMGYDSSAAITENGDLYIWGSLAFFFNSGTGVDRYAPIKIMSNVKAVDLDRSKGAAITENGDLYTWGSNQYYQLGQETESRTPTKIMSNVKAVSFSGGGCHGAAITENGDLYTWGFNGYGQLGDGTRESRYTPTKIMSNVKAVSLGDLSSAAITENGDLYTWGSNYDGELGDETEGVRCTPEKIMSNVKAISLCMYECAAITETGDLYTWGSGYLGNGTKKPVYTPTKIMSNIKAVSLGEYHCAAITENGDLYTWGLNSDGQLGDGTTVDKYTPTKITIPSSTIVSQRSKPTTIPSGTTGTLSELNPGGVYNVYAMKSATASNPLSSDNLLYISQETADENGSINLDFTMKEEYENAVVFAVPMKQTDISAAAVKMDNLKYTGEEQFVNPTVELDGNTLVEGIDYMLCGDYSATEPGQYTVTIRGIGLYTGETELTYYVNSNLGDVDLNGKITVADAVMIQKHIANIITLDDEQFDRADVDGNGKITVADAVLVQKHIANIISIA